MSVSGRALVVPFKMKYQYLQTFSSLGDHVSSHAIKRLLSYFIYVALFQIGQISYPVFNIS